MEVNISSNTKITRFTRENDIASNIRYCPWGPKLALQLFYAMRGFLNISALSAYGLHHSLAGTEEKGDFWLLSCTA